MNTLLFATLLTIVSFASVVIVLMVIISMGEASVHHVDRENRSGLPPALIGAVVHVCMMSICCLSRLTCLLIPLLLLMLFA